MISGRDGKESLDNSRMENRLMMREAMREGSVSGGMSDVKIVNKARMASLFGTRNVFEVDHKRSKTSGN